MNREGGCYCKRIRYSIEGESLNSGECLCRECQYISGGGANVVMIFPAEGFKITKGEVKKFAREDLEFPVTRGFCQDCGTHLFSLSPHLPTAVIVKVGTLDDPSLCKGPDYIIWTSEKQAFHHVPENVPSFPTFPTHPEQD